MADDLKFVISVDDRDLIRAQKEQRKFQANVITIEQAYRSGAITASRYNGELAKQASQLSKLGGNYNKANSEVRKYAYSIRNATNEQLALSAASVSGGKSVNRFGMYAQQVGYQVGDFFVQVQSGTSALVAFGQQGTQLAGLLPGLTGAVVGIGLAVGTMLARSFLQAQEASEAAGGSFSNLKDVIKEVAEELKVLNEELEFILSGAESKGIAAVNKKIAESFVEIYAAANLLKDFKLDITPSMSATEVEEITQLFQDELRLTQQLQEKKLTLLLAQKDALVQQREQLEIIKGLQNSEVQEAENLRQNTERANRKEIEDAKIKKALQDQRIASFYKFYTQSRMEGQNLLVEQEAMTKAAQDAMNKYGKMRTVAVEAAKALKEAADQTFRIAQAALALNKPMGVSYQGRATGVDKSGFDYTGPKLDENNNVIVDKASKPSGTKLKDLEAEFIARSNAFRLGESELSLYEQQLKIKQALGDYSKLYTEEELLGIAQRFEARAKEDQQLQDLRDRNEELANTIASSFADSFTSIVDGTKSVKDAFREMALDIVKHLFKVLVMQQMVNSIGGAVGGNVGAALQSYKFADGAAFSGGNVIPFASGGVVGSPTYFGMGGGQTGLMGEAGPEAIMPLKRGPDGKLGVATTSNSQSVTVVQNINVSTGVQQTVRAEVMGLMPQIAAASKAAVLDAKRRGGSFGGSFR
jgi:phage-related minor tail protein